MTADGDGSVNARRSEGCVWFPWTNLTASALLSAEERLISFGEVLHLQISRWSNLITPTHLGRRAFYPEAGVSANLLAALLKNSPPGAGEGVSARGTQTQRV